MSIEEYKELVSRVNSGKSASSEHDLQVSCVNWFRYKYPQYSKLLFAIPNGGYRTKTTAKYMRAEGQLAGLPDLFSCNQSPQSTWSLDRDEEWQSRSCKR